ncbi:MAG: AraC family transcriptional regulator [Planctomycetes bacterium]|nr:AraC family transcriptional regulator [Planctomycetota bacterium]
MTKTPRTPRRRPLAARERTRADHWQRVLRVLVHIGRHLDADLSLARLAKLAHLSPHHFQRVFTTVAGESCKQHVQRLRLERAARELGRTDRTVADIAADAAYSDVPAFHRAFRSRFRLAPAKYRESRRDRRAAAPRPDAVRCWQVLTDAHGQLRSVAHPADRAPGDCGPAARIVTLAKLRIAFVRRTGPVSPRATAADFARLVAFAERRGAVPEPFLVRLHHDDPTVTPPRLRRTDHGITIGPRRRGEGDIGVQTIGDHEVLVATCAGDTAVPAVRRWLENDAPRADGALRRQGPVVEVLLDHDADDASRALRDVLVPVATRPTDLSWYWRRRPAPLDAGTAPSSS